MWLKQFKYQGRFEFSVLFAQQLSGQWQQYLAKQNIDSSKHNHVVTCVPIHIRRWQQRGFNQAHLIAKRFARYSHLDYYPHMLERIHHRDAQVGQTGAARRRNLLHAFKVNDSNVLEGKHIILIDDVITTGATVNEISKQLKRLGVESITVLTVAIALPKN